MKKMLFIISTLTIWVTTFAQSITYTQNITRDDAIQLVTSKLNLEEVNVYEIPAEESDFWTFFVDLFPQRGWAHDCYRATVPKKTHQIGTVEVTKQPLRFPPSSELTPVSIVTQQNIDSKHKPIVRKPSTLDNIEVANRTYAIILSGGVNKNANSERYWNDCSFIYQTLRNTYQIPKNHIIPIISDGTDTGKDMTNLQGLYVSSPLDLDYDGVPDTELSATRDNIKSVLETLTDQLTNEDHLFFYVIDHGDKGEGLTESLINLWGDEILFDHELASWITPLIDKGASISFVLGQCFSGGFIDDLSKIGCIVATASDYNQYSWSCGDIPYDEFVYHWTCAMNRVTPYGITVNADLDNNGHISMEEAFKYAKKNDRFSFESPQYMSSPIYLGKDVSFTYLPENIDLFIRDNPEDIGKEPNTSTDITWDSPDIWVRNNADNLTIHENPVYSPDHPIATIYARITNRGRQPYLVNDENDPNCQYIHFYWAKASTALTPEAWKGREIYKNCVTGEHLRSVPIPSLQPGEEVIVSRSWLLPEDWKDDQDFHYCLLARIMDDFLDDEYKPGMIYEPKNSKKIAQKNLTLISQNSSNSSNEVTVFLRNPNFMTGNYSLELRERHSLSPNTQPRLFSVATVDVTLSQPIYEAWKRGGSKVIGAIKSSSLQKPLTFTFLSNSDLLQDISLEKNEFEKIKIKVNFKSTYTPTGLYSYTFDLIQRDENGNIIGGEAFILREALTSLPPIDIVQEHIGSNTKLSVVLPNSNYTYEWYNQDGQEIGTGDSINVIPTSNSTTYSVLAFSNQGEKGEGKITLIPETGIKRTYPPLVDSTLGVELYSPINTGSKFIISPIESLSAPTSYIISTETTTIEIPVENLSPGIYALTLITDNKVINTQKFYKK